MSSCFDFTDEAGAYKGNDVRIKLVDIFDKST